MAHFKVTYKTEYGESRTVIMTADHGAEAVNNAMDDYPDIETITSVTQLDNN